MGLSELVKKISKYRSRSKIKIDMALDPLIALTAANGAALYGAYQAIEHTRNWVESATKWGFVQGTTVLAAYAGLAALGYWTNKNVLFPIAGKIKDHHESKSINREQVTALSWVKTLGLAGLLAAGYQTPGFQNTISSVKEDVVGLGELFERKKPQISVEPDDGRGKGTLKGKLERTQRWEHFFNEAEKKYNIPKGLLAGLVMQESGGDPLQLNYLNDGGAGLMQIMPGTGRIYGLKVHNGSRSTSADKKHGREIKKLLNNCNFKYSCAIKKDERFDIPKSIDAGARYLKDMHKVYGSWDRALSAYNRGTPAKNPKSTRHVKKVHKFQRHYLKHRKR